MALAISTWCWWWLWLVTMIGTMTSKKMIILKWRCAMQWKLSHFYTDEAIWIWLLRFRTWTQNINRFFASLWRTQFLYPEEPLPSVIPEATVAMFTGHPSREPSHRHTDSASLAWSLGPTYCALPKGKMLNIDRAWFWIIATYHIGHVIQHKVYIVGLMDWWFVESTYILLLELYNWADGRLWSVSFSKGSSAKILEGNSIIQVSSDQNPDYLL